MQKIEGVEMWAVLGYEGVRKVMRDTNAEFRFEQFQRMRQGDHVCEQSYYKGFSNFVLFQDGDSHRRIRKSFQKHLTPPRVNALRPEIEERSRSLIDDFIAEGEVELVSSFAKPLPLGTISALLGVPRELDEQLSIWMSALENAITFLPMDAEQLQRANEAVEGLSATFADLVDKRRRTPGADLLSALISETEAGNLSENEVLSNSWGLYFAGHDTTTNAIGNSLMTLFRHPDQLDLLREDPSLIPTAVEELLRYEHPAAANYRILPEDTEIDGKVVPGGSAVVFFIPSANRDDRAFPEPDRFDVKRDPQETVSFGTGPHACPGRHLGKATLAIALEQLLACLPGLRPGIPLEDITWHGAVLHGPDTLPVKWDAAKQLDDESNSRAPSERR